VIDRMEPAARGILEMSQNHRLVAPMGYPVADAGLNR
jgi:hypothetical protein